MLYRGTQIGIQKLKFQIRTDTRHTRTVIFLLVFPRIVKNVPYPSQEVGRSWLRLTFLGELNKGLSFLIIFPHSRVGCPLTVTQTEPSNHAPLFARRNLRKFCPKTVQTHSPSPESSHPRSISSHAQLHTKPVPLKQATPHRNSAHHLFLPGLRSQTFLVPCDTE